jgi:hypothetical protein
VIAIVTSLPEEPLELLERAAKRDRTGDTM